MTHHWMDPRGRAGRAPHQRPKVGTQSKRSVSDPASRLAHVSRRQGGTAGAPSMVCKPPLSRPKCQMCILQGFLKSAVKPRNAWLGYGVACDPDVGL
jgi:hypothetical protein